MRQAVFVDRDGVICQNRRDHVKSWEEFRFLPGSLDALVRLSQSELSIVVITNQAVINRGIVSEETVQDIHARMVRQLELRGGRIDQVYYCPHRPDEDCFCRKPKPGLILQAAEQIGIDVTQSYLVGDATTDIIAGQAARCSHCYLVLTGRGLEQLYDCYAQSGGSFRVVRDVSMAVNDILQNEARGHARRVGLLGRRTISL